ncbi:Exodeoxyribonuclease VII [Chlorociboria aeruginascens]|nr:Exodeoxyribonuclease VII [Chlorociboria aeruginascens]
MPSVGRRTAAHGEFDSPVTGLTRNGPQESDGKVQNVRGWFRIWPMLDKWGDISLCISALASTAQENYKMVVIQVQHPGSQARRQVRITPTMTVGPAAALTITMASSNGKPPDDFEPPDHVDADADSEANLAQALRDLQRGEKTAQMLESNLTSLERKIDALLASVEKEEHSNLEEANASENKKSSLEPKGS